MKLLKPEPELMIVRVGVLARAPSDFPYRFGVIGQTEQEAHRLFDEAFVRWSNTHDLIEDQHAKAKCQ